MFKRNANTLYNDWTGEVAFDDGDSTNVTKLAREKGAIDTNDIVFAFDAEYCEVTKIISMTVSYSCKNYDEIKHDKSSIKKTDFDITLEEFFNTFKRINVSLAKKGL